MIDELQRFIEDNIDLIDRNTKESWEQLYTEVPWRLTGEFTKTILDAGINDPAGILGYIPQKYMYEQNIVEYTIPQGVREIYSNAFYNCQNLESIVIPNSVKAIHDGAFKNCSLRTLMMPDSVTWLGSQAFCGNNYLKHLKLSNNLTTINFEAFYYTSFEKVYLPASVTYIGEDAFSSCYRLTEIQYVGTKKQAIELGIGKKTNKKWRRRSPVQRVVCTDGVIEL